MKSTDNFKKTILSYLENKAQTDSLFTEKFNNPEKNIDNCITYILSTVQKSGSEGFTDDEVYSMAVHYYDEESIEIGNVKDCKVVVNHTVILTEEEKLQARIVAVNKYQDETFSSFKSKPAIKKIKEVTAQQNLFGDETEN